MKILIIAPFAFLLFSCSGSGSGELLSGKQDLKTIDSDTFNTVSERVDFLLTEIKGFSRIKDAEFEFFNVNGFQSLKPAGIPGGSSYDYRFAVKVDPADIPKWTVGFSKNDSVAYDSTWTEKIVLRRKEEWARHSRPIVLSRPGGFVELYVFEDEGIIFKRINAL